MTEQMENLQDIGGDGGNLFPLEKERDKQESYKRYYELAKLNDCNQVSGDKEVDYEKNAYNCLIGHGHGCLSRLEHYSYC